MISQATDSDEIFTGKTRSSIIRSSQGRQIHSSLPPNMRAYFYPPRDLSSGLVAYNALSNSQRDAWSTLAALGTFQDPSPPSLLRNGALTFIMAWYSSELFGLTLPSDPLSITAPLVSQRPWDVTGLFCDSYPTAEMTVDQGVKANTRWLIYAQEPFEGPTAPNPPDLFLVDTFTVTTPLGPGANSPDFGPDLAALFGDLVDYEGFNLRIYLFELSNYQLIAHDAQQTVIQSF